MTLVAYILAWAVAVAGAAANLPALAVLGSLGFLAVWGYRLVHRAGHATRTG